MIKRVYIEITNICNLSCAFCAKNTRAPRMMSLQEFEYVIKQVAQLTKYIYLHVQGEPLMHPQIHEIMDIAAAHECHVQLVTNAAFLKDHMDLVKHPALRKISFSLQSVEYQKIDPETFMKPILDCIERASAAGHPFCELRFWRDDQMDLPKTKQCLDTLKQRYTFTDSGRIRNQKILPGVYVDYSNPFEWPAENTEENSLSGTCLGALEQIAVLSDGTVVPCCLDAEGKISLGNLFSQTLSEILASERYTRMTEGFRNYRITEELCRHCTFRRRFSNHK